jgi:hypothetical protein
MNHRKFCDNQDKLKTRQCDQISRNFDFGGKLQYNLAFACVMLLG